MKYLYLVVGAVFGGGLVWKATLYVLQETIPRYDQSGLHWQIFIALLLALYYVLLPVLCLLGATLFGFLGYWTGKHLHEIDSDQMSQQIKEADVP
ncbi:MAG TPA: hypothetical protein DCE55_26330 [Planctomycetaceae bacterium]|nr:hypothetical protein [Planctomycetaceae bacterium]